MDRRLIATMAYVAYLLGGVMLAVAYSVAAVEFTAGQAEFLALIGYAGPTLAMALVWVRNYRFGAPLLAGAAAATCWFVVYFFFLHENPANVDAVTGDGAAAYAYAAGAVVLTSLATAGVGEWLWYHSSDGFRTLVDAVLRADGAD